MTKIASQPTNLQRKVNAFADTTGNSYDRFSVEHRSTFSIQNLDSGTGHNIPEVLIRLSVGLKEADDLIGDLEQAFKNWPNKICTGKDSMFQIIESFSETQIRQVHALYQNEWWANERTLDQTREVIRRSQLCLAVVDNKHDVVGFARVLTDFVFKAIVFDVIVERQYRGQRLGRMIVEAVINHPRLSNTCHLELYCLPELTSFYETNGFSTNVAGVQLMRRISDTTRVIHSC